jgi:hypothetical protein
MDPEPRNDQSKSLAQSIAEAAGDRRQHLLKSLISQHPWPFFLYPDFFFSLLDF